MLILENLLLQTRSDGGEYRHNGESRYFPDLCVPPKTVINEGLELTNLRAKEKQRHYISAARARTSPSKVLKGLQSKFLDDRSQIDQIGNRRQIILIWANQRH